jgi:hypothetical protein|nr:MAG TPA: hypothetical protein [Caudoviricetes sp.]
MTAREKRFRRKVKSELFKIFMLPVTLIIGYILIVIMFNYFGVML